MNVSEQSQLADSTVLYSGVIPVQAPFLNSKPSRHVHVKLPAELTHDLALSVHVVFLFSVHSSMSTTRPFTQTPSLTQRKHNASNKVINNAR